MLCSWMPEGTSWWCLTGIPYWFDGGVNVLDLASRSNHGFLFNALQMVPNVNTRVIRIEMDGRIRTKSNQQEQ